MNEYVGPDHILIPTKSNLTVRELKKLQNVKHSSWNLRALEKLKARVDG